MSKPMVLVFLLLILIITSQFEWKQQMVNDFDETPSISHNQQPHSSNREEVVKEKIILSQEKNIQRLNKLVQNLRKQLNQCKGGNNTIRAANQLTEYVNGHEQKFLED